MAAPRGGDPGRCRRAVRRAAPCRTRLAAHRLPRVGCARAPTMTRDPFAFFDVIFCINLDTRPERWAAARREFARLGIADRVERVPAIVHPDAKEGCRLSHIECVRRAAGAGADTVLIFEDDVTFQGFSRARLTRALDRLCGIPDWELFFLGGLLWGKPTEVYDDLLGVPILQTHAYAVHRRVFAAIECATCPIDLWYKSHLKSYCARPLLAWQRDGMSDIEHAWMSTSKLAKICYHQHAPEDRRYLVMRLRRRAGEILVRVA